MNPEKLAARIKAAKILRAESLKKAAETIKIKKKRRCGCRK